MGGVGKSTLVNEWLRLMDEAKWRGAERVYAWSFYGQGTGEGGSSDDFFADAFQWFGDPNSVSTSPWEKGKRLAKLIQEKRTLLVLDGVEPLQEKPLGSDAKIQDLALASLVLTLAQKNPGLCLLTTRMPVSDLNRFSQQMVQSANLERLSPKAGAMLLRQQGSIGRDNELETASDEYKGHALALMLLGSYLAQVANGDIRRRNEIGPLVHEDQYGGHARRVMAAYESWLGPKEQTILRMLGLFDRPAKSGEINALREEPVVQGLNHAVVGIRGDEWNSALTKLRRIGLVSPASGDVIDAHPLVRRDFGDKLRVENEVAWREGHRRLYEYLKNTAKPFPDTIQEMAPLYAAVVHGCLAGKKQEALDDIWWKRIRRGTNHFSTDKLSAWGPERAMLSTFFEVPWERVSSLLSEAAQALILNETGLVLQTVGRLADAAMLMKLGLSRCVVREDWHNAAIHASNISRILMSGGNLRDSTRFARQAVEFADASGNAFERMGKRTTLATVQHAMGLLNDAASLFAEAERMQEDDQPELPLLYSGQGFDYCDLLLDLNRYAEARLRARLTLTWAIAHQFPQDVAFGHLSLGRAELQSVQWSTAGDLEESASQLQVAVHEFRQIGDQDYVVLSLLARVALHMHNRAFEDARVDLDEAMDIATHCGFRLHEVDTHLGYARLAVAERDLATAREHLEKARKIIDETGYHRRDGEVRELDETLSKMS